MDKSVKIFFAGDFCSKPSTSFIIPSEEIKEIIQNCDIKVVNFEVPLKPESTNLPYQKRERFFQNDDVPSFLLGLGFNLFSLSNNHMFDWGEKGYLKTKNALGNASFGAGTYDEAYTIKKVAVNGVKLGFMSLSFNAYTGVFYDCNSHEGLGCAYINDLRVNHDIIRAKKEVDYLFILPHDGIEYIDVPLPETIARYRDFIDYGADAVIGTHPHCPQGWEIYKGCPIFYSLGNFFFNSKNDTSYRAWNRPHWYEGRCVVFSINGNKMSFEVINTKNRANVALDLDLSEESKLHNELICSYLQDKNAYNNYLFPLLKQQSDNDERRIKKVFHPSSFKEALRQLKFCIFNKIDKTDKEFLYILKNDLKRARLIRNLK